MKKINNKFSAWKKLICILPLIVVCFVFTNCSNKSVNVEGDKKWINNEFIYEEKICRDFFMRNMVDKRGGIYTNYLENQKQEELASGHEVISESQGLLMLYAVEIEDKAMFQRCFQYISDNMLLDKGIISWRVKEDYISEATASIDDLRIARALIYGYEKWEDKRYLSLYNDISNMLLDKCLYDDILVNNYDNNSDTASRIIDLSYLDLHTIKMLQQIDNRWNKVYDKNIEILRSGYISNNLPLYKKTYNIEKKEFEIKDNVNLIDSLLVVLHLSEVGEQNQVTIDWIKDNINDKINSNYSIRNGKAVNDYESTAIYGIVARIAKNIEDQELYNTAIKKMLQFQVKDKSNVIYGCFGNSITVEVFSFDNLQALLAF